MKKALFLKMPGLLLMAFAVVFIGCDMSTVDLGAPWDAETPQITAQPQGGSINEGAIFTISVDASASDDGVLEYQWYSYARPIEYVEHTGKAVEGATAADYILPASTPEGIHNFYVIVTNVNNSATGRKRISVKSAPVSVTVNDTNNAPYPVIDEHPADIGEVIFRRNMTIPILRVSATVEDGTNELSYQWFVSSTLSNDSGDLIPDATNSLYQPVPPEPGEYYYFVVVYNTNRFAAGRKVSIFISNPAYINVITNPNAEVPVITDHPLGAIYFSGDTVKPLTVAVAVPEDEGELSYQWYSNTTSSNTGGQLLTGADKESYTPFINTSTAGSSYYYVVVTNTNEFAENKTSTTASRVAQIVVTTPVSDDTKNPNATIAVNLNDKHQFVRGFGGMDVAWDNFPDYTFEDYENLYNPDKLGFNMLRIMILPNYTDIARTMYELTTNKLMPTKRRENYYNFVKLVNGYGGYVLASPWTAPVEWKTNNSLNGSGHVRKSNWPQYANYLRTFAQIMADNGAPIYTISIQNEPNYQAQYDGAEWTPEEMRDFFKQEGRFTQEGAQGSRGHVYPSNVPGFGGGRARDYVLTMNGESANTPAIHTAAMNDPDAKKYIDLLGRHPYGDRNVNLADSVTYTYNPREIWQTEYNINSQNVTARPNDHTWPYVWQFMNAIDITIRNNHENAYIWWTNKRFYSMIGEGESGTVNGEILPRGWGMAHFAKFANETYRLGVAVSGTMADGSTAINASNVNPGNYTDTSSGSAATAVKVLAFARHKNGEPFPVHWRGQNVPIEDITEISLVMYTPTSISGGDGFNMGTVKLQLPEGFVIRGATAMRSTAADVGDRQSQIPKPPVWEAVAISADRNTAYVTLPASNILSVRFTR